MGSKTMKISIICGFVVFIPVDMGGKGGGYLTHSHFFLSKYSSIYNKSQLFSMCLISCEKITSLKKNYTKYIFMM